MARLIDADELADYITENEDDFLYALEHKDRGLLETMIALIPTAYDIEKVVEELEELKTYNLNLADAMCDIQKNGVGRTFVCLQDVIEIVMIRNY